MSSTLMELVILDPRIFMMKMDLISEFPIRSRFKIVAESAPYSRYWFMPKAVPMVITDVVPLARRLPKRSSTRDLTLKGDSTDRKRAVRSSIKSRWG